MSWIIYFLTAGLLPILVVFSVVFLLLGYTGSLGDWLTIREVKRKGAVVIGYLCLIGTIVAINVVVILMFRNGQAMTAPAELSPTSIVQITSTQTASPTATTAPLLFIIGTDTPTEIASSTPAITPTPTTPPLDTSAPCTAAFNPPCTYTVQGENSLFTIALKASGDEDLAFQYAGLIRDLLRDQYGYIAAIPEQLRIPRAEVTRDLEYYLYYFPDWQECDLTDIDTPCVFTVPNTINSANQDLAYQTITQQLYGNQADASKCLRDANRVRHLGGDVYADRVLEPGVVIIAPDIYAPGRSSCHN